MREDFWESLRNRLDEFYEWPSLYTFKFILPRERLDELTAALGIAEFSTRETRNGKFVSFTAEIECSSAQHVLDVYQRAAVVEGLIAL